MEPPLSEYQVDELLSELEDADGHRITEIVQSLGNKATNSRIISVLERITTGNSKLPIRLAASRALLDMDQMLPVGAAMPLEPDEAKTDLVEPGQLLEVSHHLVEQRQVKVGDGVRHMVLLQGLYALSLVPWLFSVGYFVFFCNPGVRCAHSTPLFVITLLYPVTVLVSCVVVWVLYLFHLRWIATRVNLLPLLHAIAFVAAYSYIVLFL